MISTTALSFLLATFIHGDTLNGSGESFVADTTPQPTNTIARMLQCPSTVPGAPMSIEPSLTIPGTMPTTSIALAVSEIRVTTTVLKYYTDGSGDEIRTILTVPSPTPHASAEIVGSLLHVTTTKFSEATSDQSLPSKAMPSVPHPGPGPTPTGNEAIVAGIAVILFVYLIIILCVLVCCFHMHK